MRARSVTVFNLDEELNPIPGTEIGDQPTETADNSNPFLHARKLSRNISDKARLKNEKKLAKLARSHAELWQENETSIVLKMLDDSMKSKDSSRFNALQRSLLDIERKPDRVPLGSDEENDLSPLPPAELPFNLPSPILLQQMNEGSRNMGTTGNTASTGSLGAMPSFSPAEQEYLEKAIKQNVKQYDAQLNVMIVGNGFTGKTSVTAAMVGSKFEMHTPRSTGLDSKITYGEYNGKKIRYKLIDTDPDKSKEYIRKVYYDMASAIIILYDVTDLDSFSDAQFWHKSIREHCSHNPLILLVGNKIDQSHKRAVSTGLAEHYATQNGMHFFEVSAKDVTSIDKLLPYIASHVLDPKQGQEGEAKSTAGHVLGKCALA